MAITLYNELQGTKTTGGTWTRVSATGPSAPGTYNGTIDLTGYASGIYIYRYTVTSSGKTTNSDLSINWNTPPTVHNNNCTGATLIATHTLTRSGETEVTGLSISNNGTCADATDSTLDATTALPTQWGVTATADNWFKVRLPQGNTSPFEVIVSLVTDSYGEQGVEDIMVALYTGTCGSLTLKNAEGPVSRTQLLSSIALIPASNSSEYMYIRVGIPASTTGLYDMLIQTNL